MRWQDIDPEAGSLRVVGSLGRARAAGLAVTNPKTARSRRRVELTATAVGALQRHRAAQAAERLAAGPWCLAGDLVFTN